MKYLSAISILLCMLVVTFMLQACHRQPHYHQRLVQADSLMWQHPDSALALLETFPTTELTTEADSAYFALLITQARDKNFIEHTSDSFILQAANYYKRNEDIEKHARTHYYLGSVYRDMNRYGDALREFLSAIPLFEKKGDLRFLSRTYNNIGNLFYQNQLPEKADSIYRLVESIALQLGDSSLWSEAVTYQGEIHTYTHKDSLEKVEQELQKSLNIAQHSHNTWEQSSAMASLSKLYYKKGEGSKSLQYALNSLNLLPESSHKEWNYLLLGKAYYLTLQYDSAYKYLTESLPTANYSNKASAYKLLSDIARNRKDYQEAIELERMYSNWNDSLMINSQDNFLIDVENQFFDNILETKNRNKLLLLFACLISCVTVFIIIWMRLNYRHQKTTISLIQKEDEINNLQKVISQHNINKKEEEALKNDIKKLRAERHLQNTALIQKSDVFSKMQHIIKNYKENSESDIQLNENDWAVIIAHTDKDIENITELLTSKYHLSYEEIRLCCLCLNDFSIEQIGYLMGVTRDTIYKRSRRIMTNHFGIQDTKGNNLKDTLLLASSQKG